MSISAKSVKTTLETIYSKRHLVLMFLVACLFIWIGAYVYNRYIGSYLGSSLEGYASGMGDNAPPPSDNEKTATLYMFGTSWCPHCKTAKPIWDDYISNNENLKVGNYDILFKSVDCDAEKNIADKFNVKGYPTFKLERGPSDIVEFEAKPTHDNFTSLLQTSLT